VIIISVQVDVVEFDINFTMITCFCERTNVVPCGSYACMKKNLKLKDQGLGVL
jgi:hypothetical protein